MGTTPILLLPLLSEGQAQKEITHNTDLTYLEGFVAGYESINVSGSANVTLSEAQMRNMTIVFTGVLTADINVIIPGRERFLVVSNQTAGAFTLTLKTAAGTGVALAQGKDSLVVCDGSTTTAMSLAVGALTPPVVIPNSATPSPVANATVVSAQDTAGVDGKSGLLITTEDGTNHILGDKVGLGVTTSLASAFHFRAPDGDPSGLTMEQFQDGPGGAGFNVRHARGTAASPVYLNDGDGSGGVQSFAWARNAADTADAWLRIARIRGIATEKDAQGRMGGALEFMTSAGVSAVDALKLTLTGAGNLVLGTSSVVGTGTTKGLVVQSGTPPSTFPADKVSLVVQDTGATAGKAGLLIVSEDGTQHIFGHRAGIGLQPNELPLAMLHVRGLDTTNLGITLDRHSTNVGGAAFRGRHARGTTVAPTVLLSGDSIASLLGSGYVRNAGDTSNAFMDLGFFDFVVDSVDAQGRAGCRFVLSLGAGVSAAPTEVLRVTEAGNMGIGLTTPTTKLHVENATVATGQVSLGSQRAAIVAGNVLGGVEFLSNDTSLTAPGLVTAALRAVATQAHTAAVLGTSLQFFTTPASTIVPVNALTLTHDGALHYKGLTTVQEQAQASLTPTWVDATDATRKSRLVLSVYDTAVREVLRGEASGTAPMIGFLGATAVVRQTLAAAATDAATTQTLANSLRTALINLGLGV